MRPSARLQAAIDILSDILDRGRAASVSLADWGRAHRYAGSGDRAAIGNLVYDALRKKQSFAYRMQNDTPRSLALAALRHEWHMEVSQISALCDGSGFAPQPMTEDEATQLNHGTLNNAPPWIEGDYPQWLNPSFEAAFGTQATAEGAALASRAPIDLRVNTLKATREKVVKAFAHHAATLTPYSPLCVRLPARQGSARSANVEADPAHGKGWFEVQDEGSQIAALLTDAQPRQQVADICAGAGGKTLVFAAAMHNTGQIYAYDADATRFRPIFERLKRAGARNVQTLHPGDESALEDLKGRIDVVLIDAPCTGTGVWRRRPDAKWRLRETHLTERVALQSQLLMKGANLLKPGGRLVYVTCSVLPEENERQIEAFLKNTAGFAGENLTTTAHSKLSAIPESASPNTYGLLLTPHRHQTDGFFIASLRLIKG